MMIGFKWFADGESPAGNWTGSGGVKSITLDVLICDAKQPVTQIYDMNDGKNTWDGTAWSYSRDRYLATIQFGAKVYNANAATINQMKASPYIQIFDGRRSWLGSGNSITFIRGGDIVPARENNTYVLEDVTMNLISLLPA